MLNRLISCILAIACIGLTIALLWPAVAAAPALPLSTAGNPPVAPLPVDDAGLSRKIKEVRFNNAGLNEAIETLSQLTGANIFVQWRSLEGAGIDRAAPVTLNLRNVTLGQALSILESHAGGRIARLAHHAAEGVVTVSTYDDLEREVTTDIYDVRELLDELVASRVTLMKKTGQAVGTMEIYEEEVDELEKVITDIVRPELWRSSGGEFASYRNLGGLLIITLPPEDQRELAVLLGRIYDAVKHHKPLPTTIPATLPVPADR